MIEPDFLRKACAREEADEQAALYDEIYQEVSAEREAQGLPAAPIMVGQNIGRVQLQQSTGWRKSCGPGHTVLIRSWQESRKGLAFRSLLLLGLGGVFLAIQLFTYRGL